MSRPNILWIVTDQQRWDTLGCYGNPFVLTPNLDRLAGSGVRFDHAYCQNPVCTPSRAALMTGRYPRTTRCRQNGQMIPAGEVLVTRLLARHGYKCGLVGKLHLAPVHPNYFPEGEHRVKDGFEEWRWSAGPGHGMADGYTHWLHLRDLEYKRTPFAGSKYVQTSMPVEHHQTTWCAERTMRFITEHAIGDSPWLCFCGIFDPHHPFDPPEEYLRRYVDRLKDLPLPSYTPGELDDKPLFQQLDHRAAYNVPGLYPFDQMSDDDHRLVRAAYWAMVGLIDFQVGRILQTLRETGQLDNTLVVFTSDHGELLGDHGIYCKGPHFYEPSIRVPLVVSCPRRMAGNRASPALVELVDLAPTLLEAAGLQRHPGMQGRSLWPMLTGGAPLESHRDDIYSEFYNSGHSHTDPQAHATMVRTATHKLVVQHGQEVGELYDLQNDPGETRNLWNDPAAAAVKIEMLKRLTDRMAWTVDPLPPRLAPW
ncbi:MAG: sulfatase-like hydrolase/transferase [Planctomycetes bacterium]|nr:sulfatase-like hydrolase/transferase [Planctomycetota bacterium]